MTPGALALTITCGIVAVGTAIGFLAVLHVPDRPRLLRRLHAALKPGGVAFLRTDDAPYFEQMVRVFDGNPLFERVEEPAELLGVETDFERHWHALGRSTLHGAWRRRA